METAYGDGNLPPSPSSCEEWCQRSNQGNDEQSFQETRTTRVGNPIPLGIVSKKRPKAEPDALAKAAAAAHAPLEPLPAMSHLNSTGAAVRNKFSIFMFATNVLGTF